MLLLLLSFTSPLSPSSVSPSHDRVKVYKCTQSSEVDASSLRGHCNVASLELLTAIAYPNAAPLALATLHDSLACRADWIWFVRRGLATAVCKQRGPHSVACDGMSGRRPGGTRGTFVAWRGAQAEGLLDSRPAFLFRTFVSFHSAMSRLCHSRVMVICS